MEGRRRVKERKNWNYIYKFNSIQKGLLEMQNIRVVASAGAFEIKDPRINNKNKKNLKTKFLKRVEMITDVLKASMPRA